MADEQVQRVKQAVDIVEVIGGRIQLKKAGRNFKGLCPFHGEKSPSFFVSSEMQMYKCFGCGVSGDVISFVEAYEGLTFPEALEQLASKAGITLQKRQRTNKETETEKLREMLHLAQEYYSYLLTEHRVGKKARDYLKERGIHQESVRDFGLGYAPHSWQGLWNYLVKKKQYESGLAQRTGMFVTSEQGRMYDRFRGRIMFPLTDFAGKVVGFSGRLLEKEVKEAKYINTPETELYHKGELLYGMSRLKRQIREADRVVVMEGEMDVISSVQAFVPEVVAVKGSALTEAQVLLIRRLTKNIVLCLDADSAGQEAMKRAIEVSEAKAMSLRVIRLTGGKDPDELARTDPKAWRELSKQTVSVYQFLMDLAFEQYDTNTGEGHKRISESMAPVLNAIENEVERDFYVKKLATRLGVHPRKLEEVMAKQAGMKQSLVVQLPKEKSKPLSRQERLERYMLSVGLQFSLDLHEIFEGIESKWFMEGYLLQLVEDLKQILGRGNTMTLATIMAEVKPEQRQLVHELYGEDEELLLLAKPELQRVYERTVTDLQRAYVTRKKRQLTQELAKSSGDEMKMAALRRELLEYMKDQG